MIITILIVGLLWNISMSADGISVKLRGKLALVGILSSVAYLTHTLVKQDRQTTEKLLFQLGRPAQILQFERGFDNWNFHYYSEHYYVFLNNRYIGKKAWTTSFPNLSSQPILNDCITPITLSNWSETIQSFPFNRTFSEPPKWLPTYPLLQLQGSQSVSLDLHLWEVERLLQQR